MTRRESEPTSDWSFVARESAEPSEGGTQMATMASPSIGAPPSFRDDFDAIEWREVFAEVRRLQMRIAKAVRRSESRTTGSGSLPAFERA